jgi:NTE family protein
MASLFFIGRAKHLRTPIPPRPKAACRPTSDSFMAAFFHFLDSLRSSSGAGISSAPLVEKSELPIPASGYPRIGLALSSGGARGLAHIGVLQVLEENQIPIAAVAGTSMGAYVGGLWCSGLNGNELSKLASTMASGRDRMKLIDAVLPPRRGFIGGARILARLRDSLGDRTFADLETPFLAIATELATLERAVFDEGDVASAILASLAVPGIVVPVVRNGVEYIDGGVCDPLPVHILRQTFDVDYVIGVNVLPHVGSLRRARLDRALLSPWGRFKRTLNENFNLFAPGNLLDILREAALGSQMRLVGRSCCEADVLIPAIGSGLAAHDYHRYESYIKIGRHAASDALPKIRLLLENPHPSPRLFTAKELICA